MVYNPASIRKEPESDRLWYLTKFTLDNLASEMYNNLQEFKQEPILQRYIAGPIKKSYNYTIDSIAGSKDINEGMVLALGVSVLVNFALTKLARNIPGIDHDTLNNYSYLAESLGGSTAFVANFVYQRRRKGESYKTIRDELIRIGMTGGSISLGPYRWGRGPTMDWAENSLHVPKDLVPVAAQFLLLLPFGLAVDLLGKPMNYLHENRHRINKKIKKIAIESTHNIRHINRRGR